MDWKPILSNVLAALLTALIPVVVFYLRKWLLAKVAQMQQQLTTEQLETVDTIVRVVVEGIEQTGTWDAALKEGKDKKAYALALARSWLEQHKVPIDVDALDAAVESAVANLGSWRWRNPETGEPQVPGADAEG